MENMKFLIKLIPFIIIPIIARYIIQYKSNKEKITLKNINTIQFPTLYKIISLIALVMTIVINIYEFKAYGIVDALIVLPLTLLFLFAFLYFSGTQIKVSNEWDYMLYRNIVFITKKFYFKDIKYVQQKKNTLFIYLNNGRKKMVDVLIDNYDLLFSIFGRNKVVVKKKIE